MNSNEIFIKKAILKHGLIYDYSNINYVDCKTKIKIICLAHGEFEMSPNNHLTGQGCKICGHIKTANSRRVNIDSFINKANKVHNNKYDYSKSIYGSTNKHKIDIVCKTHGVFKQSPDNHLAGSGCPKCSGHICSLTIDQFIVKANKIHKNKFNYDYVLFKKEKDLIKIQCPIHGFFTQRCNHHLTGNGCPKCSKKHKYSDSEFKEIANEIHEYKYDYSNSIYINSKTKISIICALHGVFTQTPSSHLSGKGCPTCCESKGEKEIRTFLKKHKITFNYQHKFKDCINSKSKRNLVFDFFVESKGVCIEFNGKQHYEPVSYFGGKNNFLKQKNRDKLKKNYCIKNKIKLITIKYSDDVQKTLRLHLLDTMACSDQKATDFS